MDTLQLTTIIAVILTLTLAAAGIGALIGLLARAEPRPLRVRSDDDRPESTPFH